MWIPDPIYKVLPPIYVVAGIGALVYSLNVVNVFSGLLLITAGIVVWMQRRSFRKKAEMDRVRRGNANQ